jgi:hypothetical protein
MSELTISMPITKSDIPTSIKDDTTSNDVSTQVDESSLEFNRKNIESLPKVIKQVDSDETTGLDLFCYIHCDQNDSQIRKQCRGVVFKGEDLIMKGFPYNIDYTENDNQAEINQNIVSVFDKCSFYDAYEGSLIRMFYYGDKWFLSTNRKLDAFRSKWATKESFGSFFKKALESEYEINERLRNAIHENTDVESGDCIITKFQSILDKSKQYMFLLLNNSENRIVCTAPERPTVLHVGTFDDFELLTDIDIYLKHPKKLEFKNIDDLYKYTNEINYRELQGVIVFAPNNLQYKILNREYFELYKIRGNEPSIKFRYLQVRLNKKYNDGLHYLYPEYTDVFEEYEKYICDIGRSIMTSYVERFIKKNYVTVPIEEFQVIRECHNWHMQDKMTNKINLNKVIEVLNQQPATNINRMIRKRIMEKNNPEKLRQLNENITKQIIKHISMMKENKENKERVEVSVNA